MRDISYQLYSSRNFPPLGDTLTMLGGLGYTQVEGYSGLFQSPEMIAALQGGLGENGLTMPTAHFGFEMVRDTPEEVVRIAKALGIQTVFVPAISDRVKDAAAWSQFGRDLADAGKPVQDAGLDFGWHNHAFELAEIEGPDTPLDLILAGSDDLKFELDLAWIQVGGGDPLDWMARYANRVIAVHLKDIAPQGTCVDEDGWADVGEGIMDWDAITKALADTTTKYFIVEHDNPSDHRRFAERSIAAVRAF